MAEEKKGSEHVEKDDALDDFYASINQVTREITLEQRREQVDFILRFSVNPYGILGLPETATNDDVKNKYKQLAMYVHPDKCKDFREDAQKAFTLIGKAKKILEDDDQKAEILYYAEKARQDVEAARERKRKNEGRGNIPETAAEKAEKELFVQRATELLFKRSKDDQEKEKIRQNKIVLNQEHKEREERKRAKDEVEAQKEWDKSREERISNWRNFASGPKTKKQKVSGGFKPPKLKTETR